MGDWGSDQGSKMTPVGEPQKLLVTNRTVKTRAYFLAWPWTEFPPVGSTFGGALTFAHSTDRLRGMSLCARPDLTIAFSAASSGKVLHRSASNTSPRTSPSTT